MSPRARASEAVSRPPLPGLRGRSARPAKRGDDRRRPPRAEAARGEWSSRAAALLRTLARGPRRAPRAAWACAAIACLNAACWSLITPPFQAPDEPSHFAYVQRLAQTGSLPTSSREVFSPAEEVALAALHQGALRYSPQVHTISTPAQQAELERALAQPAPRTGSPAAGVAASEPPLYYALETIPYRLGAGGTLLDGLTLMRLLSALMAGCTVLFVFLFVREALPGAPWAWTVAGLGVALAPMLGFMSGAVNPDALLYALSAALFYCLARGFRRGLTLRLALATNAVIALGLLTKVNFLGLLPGAVLGLAILAVRAARAAGRGALPSSLVLGLPAVAGPLGAYLAVGALAQQHSAAGTVSRGLATTAASGPRRSLQGEIEYAWQLFLPRLPGMTSDFHGLFTARQLWLNGMIGLYGWVDTVFPEWLYELALIPVGLICALLLRALLANRSALRARGAELLVYLVLTAGVMAMIGAAAYLLFPIEPAAYAQTRYLFPLLPLLGAILALAARGAGPRWCLAAGTLIVVLVLAQDIFSQLQEIARYYG
jgi:hypothetical protein